MPKGFDTGWLREALAVMEQPMHTGGKISTHLEMRAQMDHDAVLLGINANPLEVLHIGAQPAEEGLLAGFELDTGALAGALSKLNPRAAAIFDRYSGMRGRTVLSGRALFSELLVGIAGQPDPSWTVPPEYTGMSWPSPGLEKAQSKGGRCLAAVTRSMIQAFKALAYADPAYRTEILQKAMDMTAKEHLQCAKEFEATREEAERIHTLMVLFIDEQLKNEFKHEQRIAHLKKACADGVEEACRREKEAEKESAVELASLEIPCGNYTPADVNILTISPSGPADAPESCAIAPDRNVTFDRVARALAGLDPGKCSQLDIVLMDEGGAVRSIPAKLEGPEEVNFPVALNLSGAALQIVGPGGSIDIPEKNGRLDRDETAKTLGQIRATFPDATHYLLASAETKWETVAAVLVAASCAKGGPHPVVFGKPPPPPEKPQAPKITPGSAAVTGSLGREAILRGVRQHQAQFKYCYEKQLLKDPTLEGKVTLKFVIAASGKVQEASVEEATLKSEELQGCMLRAARRMVFPKPKGGGVVVVTYPFVFKAAK
jgi:TonB family protein